MSVDERTRVFLELWSTLEWLKGTDARIKEATRAGGQWTAAVQEQERCIAAVLAAFERSRQVIAGEILPR